MAKQLKPSSSSLGSMVEVNIVDEATFGVYTFNVQLQTFTLADLHARVCASRGWAIDAFAQDDAPRIFYPDDGIDPNVGKRHAIVDNRSRRIIRRRIYGALPMAEVRDGQRWAEVKSQWKHSASRRRDRVLLR